MKGLKKHLLDFEIVSTGNPKTLVFVDASNYFEVPERPLLEITLPGYNKYFLVNITYNRVNTLNSNTIGLTSLLNNEAIVDLPDGIYTFRYKICPYSTTYKDRVHFRTTLIEEKLSCLYSKWDVSDCATNDDRALISDLAEIHALIEGTKSVVYKNQKKANEFYKLAFKLIERVMCRLDKNCH